jgi:hypothetical protein
VLFGGAPPDRFFDRIKLSAMRRKASAAMGEPVNLLYRAIAVGPPALT